MNDSDQPMPYQPFYCEENVWQLCADAPAEASVAFISNQARQCALWGQRGAPSPLEPVVWDYHVVLVDPSAEPARVWDLDSTLGAPVALERWWLASFPALERLPTRFHPMFRLVGRDAFMTSFSSDRSHMRAANGAWIAPPPPWPPIFDADRGMVLEDFIDMAGDGPGVVVDATGFRRRFSLDALDHD